MDKFELVQHVVMREACGPLGTLHNLLYSVACLRVKGQSTMLCNGYAILCCGYAPWVSFVYTMLCSGTATPRDVLLSTSNDVLLLIQLF